MRGAMPGFAGPFGAPELFALARRDDVESRLVVRDGARWSLAHGPFRRADFKALPARNWTLLVQGVNLVIRRGRRAAAPLRVPAVRAPRRPDGELRRARRRRRPALRFLRRVPAAGLRAPPLALRPPGRPRAEAAGCRSRSCAASRPTHDEVLAPGDMLYLPPQYAHDGVAIDACTTYSIGFRAAGATRARRRVPRLPARRARPARAATPTPTSRRSARRRAIGAAMQRRCARHAAGHRAGTARRSPASSAAGSPSRSRTSSSTPPAAPLSRAAFRAPRREARRAPRPAHAAPLRRRAPLRQRRRAARGPRPAPRRCGGSPTRARSRARRRRGAAAGSGRDPLQLVSRWLPPRRRRLTAAHPPIRCRGSETLDDRRRAGRGDRRADRPRASTRSACSTSICPGMGWNDAARARDARRVPARARRRRGSRSSCTTRAGSSGRARGCSNLLQIPRPRDHDPPDRAEDARRRWIRC